MIEISKKVLAAGIVLVVLLLMTIWCLSLYIWGERRHVAGYVFGCEATRMKSPSVQYVESGVTFCFDQGNYYPARNSGRGMFKVKR